MMIRAWITAWGVGGATLFGAVLGLKIGQIPKRWQSCTMGFAAGVMLAAALLGLLMPAMDQTGMAGALWLPLCLMGGAALMRWVERWTPEFGRWSGVAPSASPGLRRVMLLVGAMAIHNLPEGLAAGISLGTDDLSAALTVSVGIALQNIPEGMVIIAPMLESGISRRRTAWIAASTGFVEIAGVLLGYGAVAVMQPLQPALLAVAAGTMLYVVADTMIPEMRCDEQDHSGTLALLAGLALMLPLDMLAG